MMAMMQMFVTGQVCWMEETGDDNSPDAQIIRLVEKFFDVIQ